MPAIPGSDGGVPVNNFQKIGEMLTVLSPMASLTIVLSSGQIY